MAKRYFTLAEANALVPQIESMILQVQAQKKEIEYKNRRLQEAKQASNAGADAFFQEEAELEFLVFSANSLLQQIFDTGAEVKDIDAGLVDFYTQIDGQDALLCWHLGEPQIRFWHGVYEGFNGRKPI